MMFLRTSRGEKKVRRRTAHQVAERRRLELRVALSARELFPVLRERLLAQRPIIGDDKRGNPIYGPSKFRNVYDAKGRHV